MAMLLRASRSIRALPRTTLRSGSMRTMCTAVVEEAEAVGNFSPTKPHNQMFYAICGATYLWALRWQSADRKLAKEIAEYKAEHPAAPAAVAAATPAAAVAAAPTIAAAPSAVTVAITSAPVTAAAVSWKVDDVVGWLSAIELGQHADAFKTHSVNGKMLLALSEQDLYSTLGVASPLHRKKILMEIASLRKAYLNP